MLIIRLTTLTFSSLSTLATQIPPATKTKSMAKKCQFLANPARSEPLLGPWSASSARIAWLTLLRLCQIITIIAKITAAPAELYVIRYNCLLTLKLRKIKLAPAMIPIINTIRTTQLYIKEASRSSIGNKRSEAALGENMIPATKTKIMM